VLVVGNRGSWGLVISCNYTLASVISLRWCLVFSFNRSVGLGRFPRRACRRGSVNDDDDAQPSGLALAPGSWLAHCNNNNNNNNVSSASALSGFA